MYILRITFKSINKINNFKQHLLNLQKITKINNVKMKGLFFVKNKNKIFTVLRSPHVNKKSREHFIYKNYHQKMEIEFYNIFQLFNFLIIIKKILTENLIIKTKIIQK